MSACWEGGRNTKYAILDDANRVVNIAESAYQVETNWREIPSNTPVAIGDTMAMDNTYLSPEGELRMTPEMRSYLEKINLEQNLEQKDKEIEALKETNDDIILMMADLIGGKEE